MPTFFCSSVVLRVDDCRRAIDQVNKRMMTMIENDGGQFEFHL
jgi:hypothetical protein